MPCAAGSGVSNKTITANSLRKRYWDRNSQSHKIARTPHEPPTILSGTPELEWIPLSCGMVGCWQINSILASIGRKHRFRMLNQVHLLMKCINMGTVYLFYKVFIISEIKVSLINYSLSKAASQAVENNKLAEWRSGSESALPCERPGFGPHTCLREIILTNNCTMQGQNNWGKWGSPGVMKLWVAWEVLQWLMKFWELCSGGFHLKLV